MIGSIGRQWIRGNRMRIRFKDLQTNCRHQGWIKSGGVRMCSYKNRVPATCWDDWQECKEQNCPLGISKAAADIKGQLSLIDIIERA